MGFKSVYVLPVILFVLVPVSFLTTYTIAVLNEHVEPGFPYISDTGSSPPESCIFGQLLNIAAFMFAVCVYIKYLQVQSFTQFITPEKRVSHTLNKVALSFGLTSCVGLDIVANFQESNVIVVHLLGAFLCFAAGTVYFILQVWISYKSPGLASKHLLVIRTFLVGICIVTTVSTVLTAFLAFLEHEESTMVYERVYLLPLAIFVIFPCTFLGTYISAVLLGHVEPDFPYISDAATYSPESCVFGQLMNGGTVLLVLVMYIRYRQIGEYYRGYALPPVVVRHNKIALWIGFLSCFGLSLVANFQETNVIVVHLTGAFLCFGLGTVYIWLQAICSYYLHPLANSIFMAHMRVVLAMVCTVFFILLSITGVISHLQFHGKDPRKWYPEDGGWEMHVASTVSEWIVATSFCVYILSFVQEFRAISVEEPQIFVTAERNRASSSDMSPVIAQSSAADEVDVIVTQDDGSIIT